MDVARAARVYFSAPNYRAREIGNYFVIAKRCATLDARLLRAEVNIKSFFKNC
jgi:hypothetical protein